MPTSLRNNVLILTIVHASNYLVPLIALPYLLRTLGSDSFGRAVYIQTVITFFVIIVDFGFSWSATRAISEHRNNKDKVSHLFIETWLAQWGLCTIGFSTLLVLIYMLPSWRHENSNLFIGYLLVVGQVLFPTWLFQGLERFKAAAVLQFAGKAISLPLLFLLVKTSNDIDWAILFLGSGQLITGLLSLIYIYKQNLIKWHYPSTLNITATYREGLILFTSKASISLYTNLIPFVLGTLAGSQSLAYYNLADRIRNIVQSLVSASSQALLPRMSSLFSTTPELAWRLAYKIAALVSAITLPVGMLLFLYSEDIIILIAGESYKPAASALKIMSFVPWLVCMSTLFGIQIMIPLQLNKQFTAILLIAASICLLLLYAMIELYSFLGAAWLVFIVEFSVSFLMGAYIYKFYRQQ